MKEQNTRFTVRYFSKQENRYLLNFEIQAIFGMSCLMQKPKDTGLQAINVSLSGDNEELYVTEQCTGLRDKTGKLIFEGDIVRTVSAVCGVVSWLTGTARFIVECDDGTACNLCNTQEVIGNIHEVEK